MVRYRPEEFYRPGRDEGDVELRLTAAGCQLTLFYTDPSIAEITAVAMGQVSLALVVEPCPVALFRVDGPGGGDVIAWTDLMWSVEEQDDPAGVPGRRGDPLLFRIALVDCATDRVAALRTVAVPPVFADGLRGMVAEQVMHGYDEPSMNTNRRRLFEQYRTAAELLRGAAQYRCIGGTPPRQS